MVPPTNNPVPAPVRLAPIIRAPEREENSARTRPQQRRKPKPMFTVYVNSASCEHSVDLLREIREVRRIPCSIVDIAHNVVGVPTWLRGTPSIVVGTDVYCGDTAFDYVESLCFNHDTKDTSNFHDIISGKGSTKHDREIGCGLVKAFSPPVQISEEEASQKYSGSVDDAMARLMQSRGP